MFFRKPYSILTTYDRKLHEKTLRHEGRQDLLRLITLLLEDGRDEDIRKLASDDEYLRQLLKEYNLEDDSSYII